MTRADEGEGELLDADLRDEIELVSDLVVAASASDRHFTPAEVDALLGIGPEAPDEPAGDERGSAAEPADG
ncbi:hypothetical protein [Intrasporangium sp.]|uniref:hypothetical protein n=1 Tax=Intrasporangium sp. TaxID=1925024 RepID=UPI003221B235